MNRYIRDKSQQRDRELIESKPIPERLLPSALYVADRILGKVSLCNSSSHISLLLDTFDLKTNERLKRELSEKFNLKIKEDYSDHKFIENIKELPKSSFSEMDDILLNAFLDSHGGKEIHDELYSRALSLKDELGLDEGEAGILYLLYLANEIVGIESLFGSLTLSKLHSLFASILDIRQSSVEKYLSESGRLIKMNLLEQDFFPPPHYTLTTNVVRYFSKDEGSFYKGDAITPIGESLFNPGDFPFPPGDIEIVSRILRKKDGPAHILFYGEPGTGKTELAGCLLGKGEPTGLLLNAGEDSNPLQKQILMISASKSAIGQNSVLVIDEADSLLNTENPFSATPEKGWLVNFMDKCKGKIIWISNSIESMHPAVARRFSYNLEFRKFNSHQRIRIWEKALQGNPLENQVDRESIKSLSNDFQTEAGGIAYAVSTVSDMNEMIDDAETTLRLILDRHEKLMGGNGKKPALKKIRGEYDPSFINCDGDLPGLKSLLDKYYSSDFDLPVNLLFWGDPGTGKTEYVKYLSAQTGRELMVKRASDLMGKLVGETESNIADAFREASESGSILLLDEADTFFLKRESARNSWEKTQTNELLTQMENFNGVLICCTNHLDLMDKAVLRRFTKKLQFLPPVRSKLVDIFKTFFPRYPLTGDQEKRLGQMNGLTPGDFYTVQTSLVLFSNSDPHNEMLLEALDREREIRNRDKPGVAGFR